MHKHALSSFRSRFFSTVIIQRVKSGAICAAENDSGISTQLSSSPKAQSNLVSRYYLCRRSDHTEIGSSNVSHSTRPGSVVDPASNFQPLSADLSAFSSAEAILDREISTFKSSKSVSLYFEYEPDGATCVASADAPETRPFPHLPSPDSPAKLYQNLLFLLYQYRCAPPPINRIVQYYLYLDTSLHSVKAYNLLVSLALRHSQFGCACLLLVVMKENGFRKNLETVKLIVRWQILIGRWERAWENLQLYLQDAEGVVSSSPNPSGGSIPIPLPVWMEFMLPEKGVLKHKKRVTRGYLNGKQPNPPSEIVDQDTAIYLRRCKLLWNNVPLDDTTQLRFLPPRMVYLTVQMFLKMRERHTALNITRLFLEASNNIPPSTSRKRTAMALIHLHLVHFEHRPSSIRKAYRTVKELFALCPSVLPDSTTVLLLLRLAKKACRSGTIANSWLNRCKREWGDRVEDRRVRRRVATYALKECHMAIVSKMFEREVYRKKVNSAWATQRMILGGVAATSPRRFLRRPYRKLIKQWGRENHLWKVLEGKWLCRLRELQTKSLTRTGE